MLTRWWLFPPAFVKRNELPTDGVLFFCLNAREPRFHGKSVNFRSADDPGTGRLRAASELTCRESRSYHQSTIRIHAVAT